MKLIFWKFATFNKFNSVILCSTLKGLLKVKAKMKSVFNSLHKNIKNQNRVNLSIIEYRSDDVIKICF